MKKSCHRWLARVRGRRIERMFDGRGYRVRDRLVVAAVAGPLNAIECWEMRHLWPKGQMPEVLARCLVFIPFRVLATGSE